MSYKSYLDKLLNENEDLHILRHAETKDKTYYINLIKFSDTFYSIKEYKDGVPQESNELRDLKSANYHFNRLIKDLKLSGLHLIETKE